MASNSYFLQERRLMADLASKDSCGSTLPISTGADDLASEPSDALHTSLGSSESRGAGRTSLGDPNLPTTVVRPDHQQQRQHQPGSLLTSNVRGGNLSPVRIAAKPDQLSGLDAFKKSLPPVKTPRRNSDDLNASTSLSLSRTYTPASIQHPAPSIPEGAAVHMSLDRPSGDNPATRMDDAAVPHASPIPMPHSSSSHHTGSEGAVDSITNPFALEQGWHTSSQSQSWKQNQMSRQDSGNGVSVPFDLPPPQQPLPSPWETMSGSPSKEDYLSMADLMSPLASLSADQSHSGSGPGGLQTLFSAEGRPSDKFHAEEGEDPELKHLTWVVENLQEELIRANAARISADGEVSRLRDEVHALQAKAQEGQMGLNEVEDSMGELHRQLEAQLLQKLDHQDLLRQGELDHRALLQRIAQTDDLIAQKDVQMTELSQQARLLQSQQAHARTGGQEEEGGSGASTPRSHMSSPWGTDASGSDEEDTVFSAAAAARHALASQGTASKAVNEANQAKMRETGVTGGNWFRSLLGARQQSTRGLSGELAQELEPPFLPPSAELAPAPGMDKAL